MASSYPTLKSKRTLLVAATAIEVGDFLTQQHRDLVPVGDPVTANNSFSNLQVLITGPGMLATTHYLSRLLAHEHFGLVINAGIAGSFRKEYPVCCAVNVISDCLPELGAELSEGFIPMYSMDMAKPYRKPYMDVSSLIQADIIGKSPFLDSLPKVRGITVNTISGITEHIIDLIDRTNAEVESMEGAAVLYCCKEAGIPCIQVRTISNYIAPGHLDDWDLKGSIAALTNTLKKILDELK
jgi:futalosine hydrolase